MRKAFTRCSLIGLLALIGVAPILAQEEPEFDPIVADVIEMLASDVDEAVILQWLESTDRRPADIGSQGLIALTEAGASEDLIKALLLRVDEAESAEDEAPPTAVAPREPAAAPAETTDVATDRVEAIFQLIAKRIWVEEDEPDRPRDAEWWVYLYLDGEFVGWVRPTMQGDPVETRRVIEAGTHELRVVLQRYEELRGGWFHESLSVPTLVRFEASSGEPLQIEVEMVRIWGLWRQRKDGGPFRYLIRQGTEVLAENSGTGGDPNRWQPVCEDVEANFPGADGVPKRFRNSMSRCVRWAELWTGPGSDTDRVAILAKLAEDDFEPSLR